MADLDPITWDAAATLITGALAVGAAIYVGRRQTGIAATQANIQSELLRIENLKLKADLYDRRMEIYVAARAYLTYALVNGRVAGMTDRESEDGPSGQTVYEKYLWALGASQFLSSDEAIDALESIWEATVALAQANDLIDGLAKIEEIDAFEIAQNQARASFKAARDDLSNLSSSLPKAFEDDLRLTLPKDPIYPVMQR